MAEDEQDKDGKTEEATEKKLRDARKKGDVPSSRETGNLMAIFTLFVLVVFMLPRIATRIAGVLSEVYASAGQMQIGDGGPGSPISAASSAPWPGRWPGRCCRSSA